MNLITAAENALAELKRLHPRCIVPDIEQSCPIAQAIRGLETALAQIKLEQIDGGGNEPKLMPFTTLSAVAKSAGLTL